MRMRRVIVRGLCIAALAASFFGASARGQIAEHKAPRIKEQPVKETPVVAPKGASFQPVAGTSKPAVHMNMTATNVQMRPCVSSPRTETRLGVMKNSAAYSHCDFP